MNTHNSHRKRRVKLRTQETGKCILILDSFILKINARGSRRIKPLAISIEKCPKKTQLMIINFNLGAHGFDS